MAKAYDGRAGAYEQVGQIKLAILDSKQVTILLPNSYRGFYRAAKLLIRLERFEQAKKMLVTGMTKSDVGNQLLLVRTLISVHMMSAEVFQ